MATRADRLAAESERTEDIHNAASEALDFCIGSGDDERVLAYINTTPFAGRMAFTEATRNINMAPSDALRFAAWINEMFSEEAPSE